jgi:tRNA G18 (ribose-2'-O)-methylase SpoU
VTVASAAGEGTERYEAPAVLVQKTRAARIASEVAQASRGAAGTIPLAAASRVPAYGG